MSKNLLIVESPAKAKTIKKYLGTNFEVKSSYGHIRDLAKSEKAVDIENDFKPTYIISPEKKKVVQELKTAMKKAEEVWLATDEDREGEAIAWHLCKVLDLDEAKTKRIAFREITKPAIQKAIQAPRLVDTNLVNAQQARRVLDRLVGFELSSLLWRKVKNNLSAGRVQSVAVKLIVEKERAIQKFNPTPFYKISALFFAKSKQGKRITFKADLSTQFAKEKEAEDYLNQCKGALFTVSDVKVRPTKRKPAAPFTTSTLQQEASRKLGFSVSRTMSVAQRLYENGHITYMRTDSVNLSQQALDNIADTIEQDFGLNYVHTRQYKGKKQLAQEAHEAIRPTYAQKKNVSGVSDEQRLYELIWKRTIASQMAEAQIERTTAGISISTIAKSRLVASGEVIKFDGFLKVYLESTDDDEETEETKGMLPPLAVGQVVDLKEMTGLQRFTRPPARYTEASLVKKLEELGIGRPSTYAPTISRITEKNRGYVLKETREGTERKYTVFTLAKDQLTKVEKTEMTGAAKNKLFSSDLGMIVSDFLSEHFGDIMDYNFTADIEKQFDTIAMGKLGWGDMLGGFYHPFHENVQDTLENAARATGERILGKHPESGRTILVRMSKFGPVAQIGNQEELGEDEKPQYANLKRGQSIETITLEDTMELFKLPRVVGQYEDTEVVIGAGRYGPYVKFDGKFISIPRIEDPLTLSLERSIELIEQKRKEDAPMGHYEELPITKGKGRFGPFLKWNGWFINVPKRYDFENISMKEAAELIEAKKTKEANRYVTRWVDEKIDIENGRWGPFIRFKKKSIKLPKKEDGKRMTSEEAKELTLEEVKKLIEAEIPDAFVKKTRKKPAAKKTTTKKKTTAKKTTTKKTTTRKKKS